MKFAHVPVGQVLCLVVAVAVVLWAAGVLPAVILFKVTVASLCLFFLWAGALLLTLFASAFVLQRTVKAAPRTTVMLGIAEGLIREGEMVRFDVETRKVRRSIESDGFGKEVPPQ